MIAHVHENLGFLKASASSFDAGHTGEAKRLAVTIRVLFHDTQQSKSLLGLLGWKQGVGFLDTAYDYNPSNLMSHHGLVRLRIAAAGSYDAPLDQGFPGRPNRYVFFPEWWNKTVIVDSNKNKFNRRELVLALANKDGGRTLIRSWMKRMPILRGTTALAGSSRTEKKKNQRQMWSALVSGK